MKVTGSGEVFIADQATDIIIMYLENDMVSVNGRNVLAFSDSIEWDIQRVGSGMTACRPVGSTTWCCGAPDTSRSPTARR